MNVPHSHSSGMNNMYAIKNFNWVPGECKSTPILDLNKTMILFTHIKRVHNRCVTFVQDIHVKPIFFFLTPQASKQEFLT